MSKYFPSQFEAKWQKKWEQEKIYNAKDFSGKKFYSLIEFPYPSGLGLHVGHTRSWCAMDCYSRKKRMEGYNVLYPIGWDAFGLPAENFAIKNKIHPSVAVEKNIERFKNQIESLGLSFDWAREINTTDPTYYKWTQWIFVKLFEKGLAYQADVPVNWCPGCKTNLADEEVVEGKHERCNCSTERRVQKQWMLKITDYAEKLLEGLKTVDYPNKIRVQQENWIGKSQGAEITFPLKEKQGLINEIKVFTTRPDTIFGVTALIIAPEHPFAVFLGKKNKEVDKYIKQAKKKSEMERTAFEKSKTGVFTGEYAVNPLNKEEIPVWIGDYVVGWYGKGAVMFVPAHDQRDYEFAKKHGLKIKEVIAGGDITKKAYEGKGKLINSGKFEGLDSEEAKQTITNYLKIHHLGGPQTQFKLRDWIFSRQHYWGEPIPVIHCEKCGIVPVPQDQLPVKLPYLEKYEPTKTGESPLAKVEEWINAECPKCKGKAKRETDTMPNWAGSNWYYLRYLDPGNNKELADRKKIDYWMSVDLYQGGFEHTTLHLLYSRFIYKFLFDIGVVPNDEPYLKRRVHGIVLGPDGRKMSKSFGNVLNPDDIVKTFGADTLRIYEMFMGPFDQTIAWSEKGVEGSYRFLKRVWQLCQSKVSSASTSAELKKSLNKMIKRVGEDLEAFKFNTAVAFMMEFINDWQADEEGLDKEDLKKFLLVFAPFAPFITEELWNQLGEKESIHLQSWPEIDEKLLKEEKKIVVVQVNGKTRGTIVINDSATQKETEEKAMIEKVKANLEGKKIKKVIYVKGKIINFVTD